MRKVTILRCRTRFVSIDHFVIDYRYLQIFWIPTNCQTKQDYLHYWQCKDEQHHSVNIEDSFIIFIQQGAEYSVVFIPCNARKTYPTFLHMRKKFFCNNAFILPLFVIPQHSLMSAQSLTNDEFFIPDSGLPFIYFIEKKKTRDSRKFQRLALNIVDTADKQKCSYIVVVSDTIRRVMNEDLFTLMEV